MKRSLILLSLLILVPQALHAANVILISIDTLRADRLSCYGYQGNRTSNIDRWASEGIRFERAYTEYPLTLPAHATLLTGAYPLTHGVLENVGFALDNKLTTLAEVFKRNGYSAGAFIGSYVLSSRFGMSRGFDTFDEEFSASVEDVVSATALERPAQEVTGRFLKWLEGRRSGDFFAFVHFYDPHMPRPNGYDWEVSQVDRSIGLIDEYLRRKALLEKTYIFLVSDHGESLGEHSESGHGFFLYDSTLHVPLVIRPAAGFAPARRIISQAVSLADVMPTIMQIAGLKGSPQTQGKSLVRLMSGRDAEQRGMYAETYVPQLHFGWSPLRSFRLGKYKLIDAPRPELYDLTADPAETADIFSRNQALAHQIRERMAAFAASYGATRKPQSGTGIDREAGERLAALGYIALPRARATSDFGSGIDPKDRIAAFEAYHEVLNEIAGRAVSKRTYDQISSVARMAPEIRGIAFLRALTCDIQGRLAEAVVEYRAALKEDAGNGMARAYLAGALIRLGNDEEAERELKAVLAADPGDYRSRGNLAGLYRRKGRMDAAIAEMKKAVEVRPTYAAGWHNLGQLYGETRHWEAAEAALRKSVILDRRRPLAHFHLAYVLRALGRTDEADREMRIALELDPNLARRQPQR